MYLTGRGWCGKKGFGGFETPGMGVALWVEVCALSALCALWVEVCALSALCAFWVEVCALSAVPFREAGNFQLSLRDFSSLESLPRTASWAKFNRPSGTHLAIVSSHADSKAQSISVPLRPDQKSGPDTNGVFQQPAKPLLPPVRNYNLVSRSSSAELILLVMSYDW